MTLSVVGFLLVFHIILPTCLFICLGSSVCALVCLYCQSRLKACPIIPSCFQCATLATVQGLPTQSVPELFLLFKAR